MDEELKHALQEDETILVESAPESFEIMDKTNKSASVRKMIITVVVSIALIIAYAMITVPLNNFKMLMPIIIIAACAMIISGAFMDARKVKQQHYYLTNHRILWKNETLFSIPYKSIEEYTFRKDEDGHTTLLIGKHTVKMKSHEWRTFGAAPVITDPEKNTCERAILYAISKPQEFQKTFEAQMKKK